MSAADALKAARAAGIQLGVDGEDLALTASVPPPATVIDLLASHKAEVVALLRPSRDGWSAQDWQVFFDERAGIVEFDAGLPRAEAEAHAFACCVVEWLNRNPAQSLAGAVSTVVTSITPTIRCCPTASNPPATPGCIHVAGPPGTRPGKPRPLRHWRRWGLWRRSFTRWSRGGAPSSRHLMRLERRVPRKTNLPASGK